MKFRFFLINEIKLLKEKRNVKVLYPRSKYPDLDKRLKQIHQLTYFLNDKHTSFRRISARIEFVENGLHEIPQCAVCTSAVHTFKSTFCSSKCQKKHFDLNESLENKEKRLKKAVQSRNYDVIHEKRLKTLDNPEVKEKFRNAVKKSCNRVTESGLTMAQERGKTFSKNVSDDVLYNRALKSATTRKEKDINSAKNYWENISEEDKYKRLKKQNKKTRETCENTGYWNKLEDKDDYDIYFNSSRFRHSFTFNKYTTEKEKELLRQYGVFHNTKNAKGCVRDHLLSRRYGFDNNIPTWIISHPANCEIVLHSENVSRKNLKTGDNQITFERLMERINNFDRNVNKL